MLADKHPEQKQRLDQLDALHILDSPKEQQFDDLVSLIADICDAPVAMISLVAEDRQWCKATVGVDFTDIPLEMSICSHAILQDEVTEIQDTRLDQRTADMNLTDGQVTMVFYAGAPIKSPEGQPLGSLCVLDDKPRSLTPLQRKALVILSNQVTAQLALRAELLDKEKRLMREQKRLAKAKTDKTNLQRDLSNQAMLALEVDHRVKNSLQLVTSMLRFQARKTDDVAIHDILEGAQQRVAAIASVHAELHNASTADRVDMVSYLTNLRRDLDLSTPRHVAITLDVDKLTFNASQTTSIAIIVNEFVANSVKYGFADRQPGTIRLHLKKGDKNQAILDLFDDGVGLSPDMVDGDNNDKHSGLGMRIMDAAARKLESEISFPKTDKGVHLHMVMPIKP